MSLAFLAKKSWHTANLKNVEKVWIAEQKHAQEEKKLAEWKKNIEEERQLQELRQLQASHGNKSASLERVEWMYQGPMAHQEKSAEEYLLGKEYKPKEAESDMKKLAEKSHYGSLSLNKAPLPANDAFTRLNEDPMMAIKKKQLNAQMEILKNPVKMGRIKEKVERMLKEKKMLKKAKKKAKKEAKKEKSRRQKDRSPSVDSSDEEKYSKTKDKRSFSGTYEKEPYARRKEDKKARSKSRSRSRDRSVRRSEKKHFSPSRETSSRSKHRDSSYDRYTTSKRSGRSAKDEEDHYRTHHDNKTHHSRSSHSPSREGRRNQNQRERNDKKRDRSRSHDGNRHKKRAFSRSSSREYTKGHHSAHSKGERKYGLNKTNGAVECKDVDKSSLGPNSKYLEKARETRRKEEEERRRKLNKDAQHNYSHEEMLQKAAQMAEDARQREDYLKEKAERKLAEAESKLKEEHSKHPSSDPHFLREIQETAYIGGPNSIEERLRRNAHYIQKKVDSGKFLSK